MPDTHLKIGDLRVRLSEVLKRVSSGERVVLERYNGPTAVLIPMADYLALTRLDYATVARTQESAMTHRLVVTNISGGEGKSTLVREIGFSLSARGYRVALIDSDPQGSLTKSLGLHDEDAPAAAQDSSHSIAPVFEVEENARLELPIRVRGVDVWVSHESLYRADTSIASDLSKQGNLRDALDAIEGVYDFIIIDTKPGITPLLNAAIAAADHMLVPVSGDKGMENLDKLARLTRAAKGFSPDIKVTLFIPNRQKANTVLGKRILEDLQAYRALAPISRALRDSVVVGEAARMRVPLVQYSPNSAVRRELEQVVDDLLVVLGLAPEGDVSDVNSGGVSLDALPDDAVEVLR